MQIVPLDIDTSNEVIANAIVADIVAGYPPDLQSFASLRTGGRTDFDGDVNVFVGLAEKEGRDRIVHGGQAFGVDRLFDQRKDLGNRQLRTVGRELHLDRSARRFAQLRSARAARRR